MKYLGRAALVLGVAFLLGSCGSVGPIGAKREAWAPSPSSYSTGTSGSSGGTYSQP